MKNKISILIALLLPMCLIAKPQWGLETELVQPFLPTIHIARIQTTRTIWGDIYDSHGDFMLGTFIRPNVPHDVVEIIDEYAASVGYRHYFGPGWHLEGKYYLGYVWGKNNEVDGKDYQGVVQFAEALAGYRFFMNKSDSSVWYIIPQFGILTGLHGSDIIGPRDGKTETFLQGNLIVGYNF